MTLDTVNREQRLSPWFAAWWVLATSVFAGVALWAPRAVNPTRLPILQLDAAATQRVLAKDSKRAKTPPHGRWVDELRALYAEVGRSAHQGVQAVSSIRARYHRIETVVRAVRERHGMDGLWALRAQATARLWDALEAHMPEHRRQEILGKFANQLVRYGARTADGKWRAPPLVVHAMFKARWNLICSLDATAGFAPVEVQAYEGWLALHAGGAPPRLRQQAARRFAAAGGQRGHEAVAVWAARLRAFEEAAQALDKALAERRSVRLRNYAIALHQPFSG